MDLEAFHIKPTNKNKFSGLEPNKSTSISGPTIKRSLVGAF